MTKKLWIATLLAAAVFGSTSYARGGDDHGWRDNRHDRWEHRHHDHWRHQHRHDHWGHRPPPAYAYGYGQAYRPAPPAYYDHRPGVRLPLPPLPPSPLEVHRAVRDALGLPF